MWGLVSQIKDYRTEKVWTINALETLVELRREPTKEDLREIIKVLKENGNAH